MKTLLCLLLLLNTFALASNESTDDGMKLASYEYSYMDDGIALASNESDNDESCLDREVVGFIDPSTIKNPFNYEENLTTSEENLTTSEENLTTSEDNSFESPCPSSLNSRTPTPLSPTSTSGKKTPLMSQSSLGKRGSPGPQLNPSGKRTTPTFQSIAGNKENSPSQNFFLERIDTPQTLAVKEESIVNFFEHNPDSAFKLITKKAAAKPFPKEPSCDFSPTTPTKNLQFSGDLPKIAIIGGGLGGSLTAALLAKHGFESEIFERNENILNGSTSETAAVIHWDAIEYSYDFETASNGMEHGSIFIDMLSRLYANKTNEKIKYIPIETGKALLETDKELSEDKITQKLKTMENTHIDAINHIQEPRYNNGKPKINEEARKSYVRTANSPDFVEDKGVISSSRDRPMLNIERNAFIKKNIASNKEKIQLTKNCTVTAIKECADDKGNKKFSVQTKGSEEPKLFDHVILSVWDQTEKILEDSNSESNQAKKMIGTLSSKGTNSPNHYKVQTRIMGVADISKCGEDIQNGIFFMSEGRGGGMIMPIGQGLAEIYACIEGGSYPRTSETDLSSKKEKRKEKRKERKVRDNLMSRNQLEPKEEDVKKLVCGEIIIEHLKYLINKKSPYQDQFNKAKLLGIRELKVVTIAGQKPIQRPYEAPTEIKLVENDTKSIIKSVPLKATYTARAALDTFNLLLTQISKNKGKYNEDFINSKKELTKTYIENNKKTWRCRTGPIKSLSEQVVSLGEGEALTQEEINAELRLFLGGLTSSYPDALEHAFSAPQQPQLLTLPAPPLNLIGDMNACK